MSDAELLEYARGKVLYHIADASVFGDKLGLEEQTLDTMRHGVRIYRGTTLTASTTGIRDYRMRSGKEANFLPKNVFSIYTADINPTMGVVHTISRTLDFIPLISVPYDGDDDQNSKGNSGQSVKSCPPKTIVTVSVLTVCFTVFYVSFLAGL